MGDPLELFDLKNLILTIGLVGLCVVIFIESGLFFGFFLPGDSPLFTAGFLASQGYFDLRVLIPLTLVSAIGGNQFGYWFGHRLGRPLFERDDSLFFRKKYLLKAEEFFEHHGAAAIVLARFLPAVRTFTPIVAGAARMRYRRFAIFNTLGGTLWVVGLTLGGYAFGSFVPDVDRYLLPVIVLIIVVSALPTALHLWAENRESIVRWARARLSRGEA